jgi:hypothetical protein
MIIFQIFDVRLGVLFTYINFANRCIILFQVNECVRGITTVEPVLSRLNVMAQKMIFLNIALLTATTEIDTASQHSSCKLTLRHAVMASPFALQLTKSNIYARIPCQIFSY